MKIKFKRLEIHNFLSYQDEVFDFEDTKGMNLITGKNLDIPGSKNGVGKSGLALALTYGIFGELPFKLGNKNIPNRFLKDNVTRVCVYLDSERKHYKICTGMRGKSSNCSLYEIVNGKEKDITKSTIAETRTYIQKEIVNADINLFMRTIFLNSDPSYNFYNLSSKDKKEFIDNLFDISLYGEMFAVIHRDNLGAEREIVSGQNRLMVLMKNSEEYENRSKAYESEHLEKLKQLEESVKLEKKILEERRSASVERDSEEFSKISREISDLNEKISTQRLEIQKSEFSQRTLKGNVSVYESRISDREKIIAKHDILKSKLCEDCKGIFSKHYKLETYKTDIEKLRDEISKTNDKMKKEGERCRSLTEKKNATEKSKRELEVKISEMNSLYEKSRREVSESEVKVNSILSQIEAMNNSKNPYLSLLEDNSRNIKEEEGALESLKDRYSYSKFLENIVNQENLKKYIIKDLVGVLNGKIKYYLHRLGANYDIIFDENMDYVFNTQDITGAEFHNFSSGEQARISIATCFAFRDFLSMRSSIVSNILILDEFIDSNVDSQAIENVVEILKDFSKTNRQNIYLVSHRQEIGMENFDRIIQIEKKNNVSSIKYLKT